LAEVYNSSDDGQLLGSGGHSTWRFEAFAAGTGRLRLTSQQPWGPKQNRRKPSIAPSP
jgi:inhibitor of cysteine peptidase